MRLVDADALTRQTQIYEFNGKRMENEIVNAKSIDNAPTIDATPKWIPCEERLPYREYEYLVTVKCGSTNYDVAVACYWEGLGFITDADFKTGDVIAWMPLPEPYDEERKDDDTD